MARVPRMKMQSGFLFVWLRKHTAAGADCCQRAPRRKHLMATNGNRKKSHVQALHERHGVEEEEIELFPREIDHPVVDGVDGVPHDESHHPGEEHGSDRDEETPQENVGDGVHSRGSALG